MIGIEKTNNKELCNHTIENLTKDWPGGSYLVLKSKPMVPRGRPLIDIGYKYIVWKVISFIFQIMQGSHRQGFPIYLSFLTSLLMFPFALFLVPFSCLSFLEQLMGLTPTKNKEV